MSTKRRTKSFAPTPDDLSAIHRYTRREFLPEELYTFSVLLCDNEVDRDFERFSIPALHALAPLFVGKTGIFDHDPSGKNQAARIYATEVRSEPTALTSCGEPYTSLVARAYMIRSPETASLIEEIEGGIKKEVSVGCAVARSSCSICGTDTHTGCMHRKGQHYDGDLCHIVLEDPTDAYEWSFVAIPAQRGAGVIKQFAGPLTGGKEVSPLSEALSLEDILKSFAHPTEPVSLSPEEASAVSDELERLRQDAELGRRYKSELQKEVCSLAYRAGESVDSAVLQSVVKKMNLDELLAFRSAYEERCTVPAQPQLAAPARDDPGSNSAYRL